MPRLTERRSKKGRDSRRRILTATFEIANELGYQGTTIAQVSSRSGLPASSVYWHFADKDALFTEVIHDSFAQWLTTVPAWSVPAAGEERVEKIKRTLHDGLGSIVGSPEFWRLGLMLALEHQIIEPGARRTFIEIRQAVKEQMASIWREMLGSNSPEHAPKLLAEVTMANADGLLVAAQVDDSLDLDTHAELLAVGLEAMAQYFER